MGTHKRLPRTKLRENTHFPLLGKPKKLGELTSYIILEVKQSHRAERESEAPASGVLEFYPAAWAPVRGSS